MILIHCVILIQLHILSYVGHLINSQSLDIYQSNHFAIIKPSTININAYTLIYI